jgi:outer membrane autotransporter protein
VSGSGITIINSGAIAGGTGANAITFTGGANTLTLQAGSNITGNIGVSGGVSFNQSTAATLSNVITGTGTVTQAGTAALTLNGVNTYSGATTVSTGTLFIGDAATTSARISSAVTINNGATLSGYGRVTGNVTNTAGGTLFAGGTNGIIGTLNVTGTYTQGANSTMQVEVSPTAASKLAVTGAFNLTTGGTINVVYDPGTYTTRTYQIATWTGASTQGTPTLTGTLPAGVLSQSASYGTNELDLNVVAGATTNNFTVAAPTNNTVFTTPAGASTNTTFTADDYMFDRLDGLQTGIDGGSDLKSSMSRNQPFKIAANGKLAQLGVGGVPAQSQAQSGTWFRALGTLFSAHGQGTAAAYTANTGGFLAGFDQRIGDDLLLGVAGGYSHTDISQKDGSKGDIDTPRVSLYGSYSFGALSFDATAGLAYDRIHTTRQVAALGATASQAHSGYEENMAVQANYVIPMDGFTLIPHAGLRYLHLMENRFTEQGAGGFNLVSTGAHTDSLQPVIGASITGSYIVSGYRIVPEFKALIARELLSTSRNLLLTTASGAASPAQGISPARTTLSLGPAATLHATDSLDIYADYKLAIGIGKSIGHTMFAGARYNF